jgi:hypothetical protein
MELALGCCALSRSHRLKARDLGNEVGLFRPSLASNPIESHDDATPADIALTVAYFGSEPSDLADELSAGRPDLSDQNGPALRLMLEQHPLGQGHAFVATTFLGFAEGSGDHPGNTLKVCDLIVKAGKSGSDLKARCRAGTVHPHVSIAAAVLRYWDDWPQLRK